jgi:hypothetical protein
MNNSIFFIEGDIIAPTVARIVLLLGLGEVILMLSIAIHFTVLTERT